MGDYVRREHLREDLSLEIEFALSVKRGLTTDRTTGDSGNAMFNQICLLQCEKVAGEQIPPGEQRSTSLPMFGWSPQGPDCDLGGGEPGVHFCIGRENVQFAVGLIARTASGRESQATVPERSPDFAIRFL